MRARSPGGRLVNSCGEGADRPGSGVTQSPENQVVLPLLRGSELSKSL